jgi:formylglycine-generating enzyme required for sulfatase activity
VVRTHSLGENRNIAYPKIHVTKTKTILTGTVVGLILCNGCAAPRAVVVKENPEDGLKYAWIPSGTFQMGCSGECDDGEQPSHQVTISKGFWIGQTVVTTGAYKRFTRSNGKPMPPEPRHRGVLSGYKKGQTRQIWSFWGRDLGGTAENICATAL